MGKLHVQVANIVIPVPATTEAKKSTRTSKLSALVGLAVFAALATLHYCSLHFAAAPRSPTTLRFYANITQPRGICPSVRGDASSYAGYIGLSGDTEDSPRRSFFWLFEAEEDAPNAPIILTFGGGPGTTGMSRPLNSQGPCLLTANDTIPNPDRVTQHYNLLALDHPIGTGLSYGLKVNNSQDSAVDVYDFLQKFFLLFPHLAKNQFVVLGGSYGGKYIPNVATVIQEQNEAIAAGKSTDAVHINLESLMISNPSSDPIAHYRWLLYFYCELHTVYDAETCTEMYAKLPECLDLIDASLQHTGFSDSANAARRAARESCSYIAWGGDTHGVMVENVHTRCDEENTLDCLPHFKWLDWYFHDSAVLRELGIPPFVNFTALSDDVEAEFAKTGDVMIPTHQLYEPLLAKGIRVLHFIGALDGNCAWPGVLSFLKLLKTPFQQEFIHAPDIPWPTADSDAATVRAVGDGAGKMTYILIASGGHFPQQDEPALVKDIMEHWINNRPWF
ncbi:alpha/beta-hydrolase [Mycena metata]|uniref:carboxypeptidase C n=1 Tax=Mycena metata TaxID=1033252 RepID=A0AAD7JZL0_9AGAR|nr:alpha/beta-hydrolase [Mycena metata]